MCVLTVIDYWYVPQIRMFVNVLGVILRSGASGKGNLCLQS